MPLQIVEVNGFAPDSPFVRDAIHRNRCPFVGEHCTKIFPNGHQNGVCTMRAGSLGAQPVICCPKRLYADNLSALRRVAADAFGASVPFAYGGQLIPDVDRQVLPFGHGQGKELRMRFRTSNFSVDWVLALVDANLDLMEFVAVEVQTIDTTGNYRKQLHAIHTAAESPRLQEIAQRSSGGGFNWENVNKRILPQLITKGHILRRENLCRKGLFFVCPDPVSQRILQRLGQIEDQYEPHPGSVTFHRYQLAEDGIENSDGTRKLQFLGASTTTTDQLATALSSPRDLPTPNSYGELISKAIHLRFGGK